MINTKLSNYYYSEYHNEEIRDIETTYKWDIVVITITVRRATKGLAKELQSILNTELLLKRKKVIVDLSNCEYLDSTFIGVLVFALKNVTSLGGDLKLVNFKSEQNLILNWNKLVRFFDNFRTVQEAIFSFVNATALTS